MNIKDLKDMFGPGVDEFEIEFITLDSTDEEFICEIDPSAKLVRMFIDQPKSDEAPESPEVYPSDDTSEVCEYYDTDTQPDDNSAYEISPEELAFYKAIPETQLTDLKTLYPSEHWVETLHWEIARQFPSQEFLSGVKDDPSDEELNSYINTHDWSSQVNWAEYYKAEPYSFIIPTGKAVESDVRVVVHCDDDTEAQNIADLICAADWYAEDESSMV